MKVILFFVGAASISLSAITASAQTATTGMIPSYYATQQAASVAPEGDTSTQALALNPKPNPEVAPNVGTVTEKASSKSMSEELSAWVENKKAVVNSYKRGKRRK